MFLSILIFNDTWQDHLITIKNVLQRLTNFNLTVKPSKCSFGGSVVQYLGFEIGNGSLKPRNDKLNGIQNFKLPRTKTELRSFLGTCQFYSKFVPNYATISVPMSNLLKKDVKEPLYWSEDAVSSFNELKLALSSPPILRLPDLTKTFVVRSDASAYSVGAILLQYHDV